MTVQNGINDEAPEPMDTSDKIEDKDEDPLNIFHSIINELISKDHLTSTDYESLGDIARNNPLAIEGKLHEIFKKILLQEILSVNDRESYDKLMTDILDASIRLRRDKKIVSWILIALTQNLEDSNIEEINCKSTYILPSKFVDEFSLSISNLTNSQVTSILTSLRYHLESCLIKSEDESKESFSMAPKALSIYSDVIKQLGVGVLEGVDMFNSRWPLSGKQHFVNALVNLGKSLLKLMKILKRKINNKDYQAVSMNLWKIIESWQILVGFIKHYAADAVSDDNWNDILNCVKNIEKIFKKVEYSEETKEPLAFLKLREHKIKCISNLRDDEDYNESSRGDIDELEHYWKILLDKYPQTMYHLDNSCIAKLSQILMENLAIVGERIMLNTVQNNRNLTIAIIFAIFMKINEVLGESACLTKKLTGKLINVNWWEDEKYCKTLKSFKKILADPQLVDIDKDILGEITKYLNILLNLPIMYCSTELKTIMFLTILTMKKEKSNDSTIDELSTAILSDLSENYAEDILQYIQPEFFISELSESPEVVSRIIELSLTNTSNYEPLRECIKSHLDDQSISMILHCIDKVRTKLKSADDKRELIKFEKKLFKKLVSHMNDGPVDSSQLKSLTVTLKSAVALKKVDDLLVEKIQSTLKKLIGEESEQSDLKYTRESYEFIKIVLQFKSNLSVDPTTIRNIWSLMMKKSCSEIVSLLVDAADIKIFNYSLNLLRKQTIESIGKNDENSFENCLIIWSSTAKPEMGGNREKIRQSLFQGLMQSLKTTEAPLSDKMKVQIIKFFTNIISSRRMIIPHKTIDLIIVVVNSFINESAAKLVLCQPALNLCSAFLKFKTGAAIENLPIIIRLYLKVIQITVDDARESSEQKQQHSLITLEVQKLACAFVKLKKDIAKLSAYIVADLIGTYYGGRVVPNYVKEPLDDAVSQFLSLCDHHGISLLSRALPPSLQEIFKILYDTYIKFHKFTGKV